MLEVGDQVTVPKWLADGPNCVVLRVVGDAMASEGILDGDLLVVRQTAVAAEGELVIACVGEDAIVRRFFLQGGMARLESGSAGGRDHILPLSDLRVMGVPVALIRRFGRRDPA